MSVSILFQVWQFIFVDGFNTCCVFFCDGKQYNTLPKARYWTVNCPQNNIGKSIKRKCAFSDKNFDLFVLSYHFYYVQYRKFTWIETAFIFIFIRGKNRWEIVSIHSYEAECVLLPNFFSKNSLKF